MIKKIILLITVFTIITLHPRQPATPSLRQYKQNLLRKEDEAFNTFLNTHINATKHKALLHTINICIQATQAHYVNPKIKGTHNKKIPQYILNIIIAQLRKSNIDPSGVTIDVIAEKNLISMFNNTVIVTNISPHLSYSSSSVILTSTPAIHINLSHFKKITIDEIAYLIAHEIEHMIHFHSIKRSLLKMESKRTDTELLKNNVWITYLSAQEKSATILPSLYDKIIALTTLNTFKEKVRRGYSEKKIHPKYKTVVNALTHIIASY